MPNCPICGTEALTTAVCGDDGLIYIATFGQYPQPEGYPMTQEEWNKRNGA